MVSSSGRDGDGAFGGFLALHVPVVDRVLAEFRDRVGPTELLRGNFKLSAEEADRFRQRGDRDHVDSFDHRRFPRVGVGDDEPPHSQFFGLQGHRQRPLGRADGTIQCQFTHRRELSQQVRGQLATCHQQTQSNR